MPRGGEEGLRGVEGKCRGRGNGAQLGGGDETWLRHDWAATGLYIDH
jgi:hypothetical protein